MPALIVRDGPSAGRRLEIDADAVLGRETHEPLQHDGEISRRHVVVRPRDAALEIEDLGSPNGTFVNDQRITASTTLRPGDVIRIGRTTLELEVTAATPGTVIRGVPARPRATPAETTSPIGADPGPGPVPVAQPPRGPPPTGPPYRPPAALGAPPGMVGEKRPGIVTAAGIVLIVAGALSAGLGVWRVVFWFDVLGDVGTFEDILDVDTGLSPSIMALIGLGLVAILGGALVIVGGARFLARSRAGVIIGIVGVSAIAVGWGGYLGWGILRELQLEAADRIAAIASLVAAGLGLGLLLGGRRHVAAPRSVPWAA